ncbi:MAG: hypothetical protein R3D85_01945 [Paracoccaceae bacterium]
MVAAYLAALTLFAVIGGRMGDRYGRRRMLLVGLLVFGAASAVCRVWPGLFGC